MKILFGSMLVLAVLSTPAPLSPDGDGSAATAEPAEDETATESSAEPLEDFIPSEEVPADSAISFPVDI
jgi:hypothetical protein